MTKRASARFALGFASLYALALAITPYLPTSALAAITLHPLIRASNEDKYQAMKSAPLIVVARITSIKLMDFAPAVKKPHELGGPKGPTIPLYLVRISASVLSTLRGAAGERVEFYSWVSESNGPRNFNPFLNTTHVLFLREDKGFLRTVGDYPAYDLPVSPNFLAEWRSQAANGLDFFERITVAQIAADLNDPAPYGRIAWNDKFELAELTSPFLVATTLDSYCRSFPNVSAQIRACIESAGLYPGRCENYSRARALGYKIDIPQQTDQIRRCPAQMAAWLDHIRQDHWPLYQTFGWTETPERHRLAMRLYASAPDAEFRRAACEAAAGMPESRDIPECASPAPK
jgi:hypothetical protein